MYATQYLEGKVAAWLRGTDFPTAPSSLKLALSTADPTDTGANLTEPVNGEYARQTIVFSAPVTNDASGTTTSNNAQILFSASGDITHFAVLDNADNVLLYGPMAAVRNISDVDSVTFAAATLQFAFKGLYSKYLAEAVVNWIRGTAMPSAPASLDFALSTSDPKRDGSGIAEPNSSTGNYDRQAVTFGAPTQTAGVGTSLPGTNELLFGPATDAPWGSISHWAIFDPSDNQLLQGAFSNAKTVPVGQGYGLNAGAVSFLIR
jgi:hypothetical protein